MVKHSIARIAKDAGMKYIIITSKHHDGFAMYDSGVCDFNIVDATPYGRDPMKDLVKACEAEGLGFGFYYSHNQDRTFPGGVPTSNENGEPADFDSYFRGKCLPPVNGSAAIPTSSMRPGHRRGNTRCHGAM
jgi:alpha-L-fucosidase